MPCAIKSIFQTGFLYRSLSRDQSLSRFKSEISSFWIWTSRNSHYNQKRFNHERPLNLGHLAPGVRRRIFNSYERLRICSRTFRGGLQCQLAPNILLLVKMFIEFFNKCGTNIYKEKRIFDWDLPLRLWQYKSEIREHEYKKLCLVVISANSKITYIYLTNTYSFN